MTKKPLPRLHYTISTNWIHPEDTVAYRGEIVRYAYEWEVGGKIETAENHIVLVDDGTGHPQLLVNVDPGSGSYCWGYSGSGPHALSMGLLAHYLGESPKKGAPYSGMPLAFAMHNDLVADVISRYPMDESWTLTVVDLHKWVEGWKSSHEGVLAKIAERLRLEAEFEAEMAMLGEEEEEAES